MHPLAHVTIHASQFPENVRRDLLESLRSRQVNHKFHYDSVKQTQKWLALHQACSPSHNDADCAATYDRGFEAAAARVDARRVHLIGLGCGGGQKDARLLKRLRDGGKTVSYTPCDVSTAMVLVARQTAAAAIAASDCYPLVCDLASADDLPAVFDALGPRDAARLITFFGMIPNFEPGLILPKLASLVRPGDWLLFSANLAPGPDYIAGVQRILPQYDNLLTRDWLLTFLLDLGVERSDGELRFEVETGSRRREEAPIEKCEIRSPKSEMGQSLPTSAATSAGRQIELKRVSASFHFTRSRQIALDDEAFDFHAGEAVRLFFSYRYTPALVRSLLAQHGLRVSDEWITASAEEGVFLCRRK